MSSVKEEGLPFRALGDEPARAKLFTHGGSQAVRLPKAFRFEGEEVEVRREGDTVVLGPLHRQGGPSLWLALDAIDAGALIDYPEQPVIDEFTLDLDR